MDYHDVIIQPLVTEKLLVNREEANEYNFMVNLAANKLEIKDAVERMFDVSVEDVRTMVVPGKEKKVRWASGYTSDWKKAIVRVSEKDVIEELEGLLG